MDIARYNAPYFLSEVVTDSRLRQNLAPVYEQLADAFAHAKDKVIIAKVDADGEGKPLGKEYGVTGYPSAYVGISTRLILKDMLP